MLLAGDEGMTEADLEARSEGLDDEEIAAAVESLIASGLLNRIEARLHPERPRHPLQPPPPALSAKNRAAAAAQGERIASPVHLTRL